MIFGWKKSEPDVGGRKLIVGLGNPGRKYAGSRHNVGFDVVAQVARDWQAGKVRNKFKGEVVDVRVRQQQVCLLCPNTYMNRSGSSVQAAIDFYKLAPDDLLVICDDFSLDLARLRFRLKGSSGGQKGLRDIIRCLGTEEFPRLRIGIGSPPANWDVADYVLSRFSKTDKIEMEQAVPRAAGAVADWVDQGTAYCMNQHNSK